MKYLGGKQRLGKHISPFLHEVWENNEKLVGYMEPFCGSLGVLKNMTDIDTKKIVANDYHADLIEMWKEVKEGSFEYPKSISEEEYLEAKQLKSPNAYKLLWGSEWVLEVVILEHIRRNIWTERTKIFVRRW